MNKIGFYNKVRKFNRRITLSKTKVQKKLNSIITNDYNFLSARLYFESNDGSQNTFFYQRTLYNLG